MAEATKKKAAPVVLLVSASDYRTKYVAELQKELGPEQRYAGSKA
jgi:hypothetical protein